MAVRRVIQAGHPNLKKKNKTVKDFNSSELKQLIKDLKATMYKSGLIGIASSQIGKNYMVFLTHPRTTRARKLGKPDRLRVYVNPFITFKSKQKSIIYEGCGSVGEIFAPVERPRKIEIQATDENENKFKLSCDGILARVIQHEMDHLIGIEFLERVKELNKIVSAEFYKKDIRNSKQQLKNSIVRKIDYKIV